MLSILLCAGLAHGDVVRPPREECVPGSRVQHRHSGSFCTPADCAHCDDGECRPAGLCIVEEDRRCGGRGGARDPDCRFHAVIAKGACESDTDCSEGTCVVAERCMPRPPPPPMPTIDPAASGGCVCATTTGAPLVFALGLLPLAWRRRRS